MIYIKRYSFIEQILLIIFGVFNLFWMQKTLEYFNVDTSTWWGLDVVPSIGFLFIFYVVSRMIGWKKREVKNNE